MRHQPFVQAMADCGGAHRPEWAALYSGFLVLRHFDDWLDVGPARTNEDREAVASMRQQIETISESSHEIRYLLETVVDVLTQAKPTDIVGAVGPLLAYGFYLEQAQHQHLGQHVLQVVTEVFDTPAGTIENFPNADDAIAVYRTIITRAEQVGTLRIQRMARERLKILLAGERTSS